MLLLAILLLTATVAPETVSDLERVEFEATLLSGDALHGRLVAWEQDRIALHSDQGEQEIPLEQLQNLRRLEAQTRSQSEADPEAAQMLLEFVDQTRLAANQLSLAKDRVTIASPWAQKGLIVSAHQLRRVQLQRLSPAADSLWRQLREKSMAGDMLLINKKNGASADYIVGLVKSIDDSRIVFEWEGDTIEVNRAKAAAIDFFRPQRSPQTVRAARLVLEDGSEIAATQVELAEDRLKLRTAAGLRLTVSPAQVRLADLSQGKVVYLNELDPVSTVWTPLVALPAGAQHLSQLGAYRRNESFTGSPLSLNVGPLQAARRRAISVYRQGLALRSRTELIFNVPPGMMRWTALAGIDPTTSQEGSVDLEVYGDRALLWQGAIRGDAAPVEITVDLLGARRLRILVDYGDNLDAGDRLHLVNARLSK